MTAVVSKQRHSLADPFGLGDFEHVSRRKRLLAALLVLGAASLVGLSALVNSQGIASVEDHLRRDVVRSVANDVRALRVDVAGRSVTIAGNVSTARERQRIVARVRGRWGVADLDASRLTVG
jgi:hypothetical protein